MIHASGAATSVISLYKKIVVFETTLVGTVNDVKQVVEWLLLLINQYKIKGKINADQMSDYCCK